MNGKRHISVLLENFSKGKPWALSRLITLVENNDPNKEKIMSFIHPKTKGAYVVGITGPQGVGKSTLIGKLAKDFLAHAHEIGIIMINWGSRPFTIRRGDRIAQMVVARVCRGEWVEVEDLDETDRGRGGFGHTGVD